MAISFVNNWVTVEADAAVSYIDLSFGGANKLENNKTAPSQITGTSSKAVSNFNSGSTNPNTYTAQSGTFSFPDGANVTITGGGNDDNTIIAMDKLGNKAVWSLVGAQGSENSA